MAKARVHFERVPLEVVQTLVKPSKASRAVRRSVQKATPAANRKQPYSIQVKP